MKVIIGIAHPKHVYIFRNLISDLMRNNHSVKVLLIEKDISRDLLDKFGIEYTIVGKNKVGLLNKVLSYARMTLTTIKISHSFEADIYMGAGLLNLAITAKIRRKPFILIEDTEAAGPLHKIVVPLSASVLVTKRFKNDFKSKQIRMNGNLELAYLHPSLFKFNEKILNYITTNPGEKVVFIRFVSWNAFHDVSQGGFSNLGKVRLVKELSKKNKVLISSEGELPAEFEKYKLNIPPELIHSLEYCVDLYIGESPTITTESAMLGTPSICVSSWACDTVGNFDELKEFDLIYCYKPGDEDKAIDKAIEILEMNDSKVKWKYQCEQFYKDHINVSSFFLWYIENFPKSHNIMRDSPEYQNIFSEKNN